MKPILDATAGNRALWPAKNPPNVVFMDKEIGLAMAPDLFATWQKLPFRDDVFSLVFFDPPHSKFGLNSIHMNPLGHVAKNGGTWWSSLETGWFGVFYKAQNEFSRVSDILCFKWNTTSHSLEKVLMVFKAWVETHRKNHSSNMKRGASETWWVTFTKNKTSINSKSKRILQQS